MIVVMAGDELGRNRGQVLYFNIKTSPLFRGQSPPLRGPHAPIEASAEMTTSRMNDVEIQDLTHMLAGASALRDPSDSARTARRPRLPWHSG